MSRPTLSPRISSPARRHWAAWLVLALLWAQGLGVWHHTVHAPGLKPALAQAGPQASGADDRSPLHHAANSADCRLLDQLLLADGLAAPVPAQAALPAGPAVLPDAAVATLALPAARRYQARAPPRLG